MTRSTHGYPPGRTLNLPLRLTLALLLTAAVLTGCAITAPEYRVTDVAENDTWHSDLPDGVKTGNSADLADWWKRFDDDLLNQLVELTLENNTDLKTAVINYRQAQLDKTYANAETLPKVSASTGASHSRSDGDSSKNYSVGASASWEIDLWGANASRRRSTSAGVERSIETLRYSQASLIAETAQAYTDLRAAQANLRVTEANIAIQEQTYNLVRWQQQSGLSTVLEVAQAQTRLEEARASLPAFNYAIDQALNRLRVLTGGWSDEMAGRLTRYRDFPGLPTAIATGIPVETLRQRPDVKAQEYAILIQAEAVAQAKMQTLPFFSLSGSLSDGSSNPGDLFNADEFVRQLAASLSYTLFDGGTLKKNVHSQQLQFEQTLLDYRATLLSAQEEAENALGALTSAQRRHKALQVAEASASLAEELARIQYQAGLVDFETVLDAQSSLLTAQNALATNNGNLLSNWIQLYRTLGGGWQNLSSPDAFNKEY